jgi:hypothetical protein
VPLPLALAVGHVDGRSPSLSQDHHLTCHKG